MRTPHTWFCRSGWTAVLVGSAVHTRIHTTHRFHSSAAWFCSSSVLLPVRWFCGLRLVACTLPTCLPAAVHCSSRFCARFLRHVATGFCRFCCHRTHGSHRHAALHCWIAFWLHHWFVITQKRRKKKKKESARWFWFALRLACGSGSRLLPACVMPACRYCLPHRTRFATQFAVLRFCRRVLPVLLPPCCRRLRTPLVHHRSPAWFAAQFTTHLYHCMPFFNTWFWFWLRCRCARAVAAALRLDCRLRYTHVAAHVWLPRTWIPARGLRFPVAGPHAPHVVGLLVGLYVPVGLQFTTRSLRSFVPARLRLPLRLRYGSGSLDTLHLPAPAVAHRFCATCHPPAASVGSGLCLRFYLVLQLVLPHTFPRFYHCGFCRSCHHTGSPSLCRGLGYAARSYAPPAAHHQLLVHAVRGYYADTARAARSTHNARTVRGSPRALVWFARIFLTGSAAHRLRAPHTWFHYVRAPRCAMVRSAAARRAACARSDSTQFTAWFYYWVRRLVLHTLLPAYQFWFQFYQFSSGSYHTVTGCTGYV